VDGRFDKDEMLVASRWKPFERKEERKEFFLDVMGIGNSHLEEVEVAVVQNEGVDSNPVGFSGM
jgi:hypothetical protein